MLREIAKALIFTSNTIRYAIEGPVIRYALERIAPFDVLLDAGAGGGEYARTIYSKLSRKLILVEMHEKNFVILKQTTKKLKDKCEYHLTSIEKTPVPSSSVDCVTCTQVLEHIENDQQVASEFSRILKPGGYALVTIPMPPEPWPEPGHVREGYTIKQLEALFTKNGFTPVLTDYFFTEQTQQLVRKARKHFKGYLPRTFHLKELSLEKNERKNSGPYCLLALFQKLT